MLKRNGITWYNAELTDWQDMTIQCLKQCHPADISFWFALTVIEKSQTEKEVNILIVACNVCIAFIHMKHAINFILISRVRKQQYDRCLVWQIRLLYFYFKTWNFRCNLCNTVIKMFIFLNAVTIISAACAMLELLRK